MPSEATYPTAVLCIIATEFCERLSFCGLRTILSLYLRNTLLFSENSATVFYHIFIMFCYIVPLLGAIFADSYYGSYRTIRNFAIIYLVGNILMCVAAVPTLDISPITYSAIGLLLVAIGTGGIKPCVAAFGGEQFRLPDQQDLLRHFFSIFYFTINLGGFVGMILTPIMRKWVACFGDDTCYALGFGFPAALILLSLCIFVLGKPFYLIKTPKTNVIVQFGKCAWYALGKRKKKRTTHWLDVSKGRFSSKLIEDMKVVCSILVLFTPLPIFWSLFDQQGSRWTFQASHMDGNVLGTLIVPDQMQVVNPAMVLVLIPVFDRIFYPCFAKLHILENSLHRMAIGGMIAGSAFLCAGVLELILERTYPVLPEENYASINVVNTLPCDLIVYNPFNDIQWINASEIIQFRNIKTQNLSVFKLVVEAPLHCGDVAFSKHRHAINVVSVEKQIDTVLIGINIQNEIRAYITDPVDFAKSISGTPRLRVAYIKSSTFLHNITVTLKSPTGMKDVFYVHDCASSQLATSAYMELPQGMYECQIRSTEMALLYEKSFHLIIGGVYSLVIREHNRKIEFVKLFTMSPPNNVNILWLVPQYFLISVAEIMFGVAGLEFSFTQAPKCMKTVTIAAWYLSVAIGNFLVIIITQLNLFRSQAYEFFMFAVLMVGDMMLFMEMASNYEFVPVERDSSLAIFQEEIIPFSEDDCNY